MTPRPKCRLCGRETARVGGVGESHRDDYRCANTQCPGFMKASYSKVEEEKR